MIRTATVTSWVTVLMVVTLVGSVIAWYVTGPRLPSELVMLTGDKGGQYYKLGRAIEDSIQHRIGARVRFRTESTTGSKSNFDRLTAAGHGSAPGTAFLAIVQGGSVPFQQLTTVAPLYPEFVHVIVRANSDINSISQLAGRHIALGLEGSGERMTARRLLNYYNISIDQIPLNEHSFKDLLTEGSPLEGAIVTTGIQHPDLNQLLSTKRFRLLSIDIAPAIEMSDPFLRRIDIPTGLYAQNPPIPSEPVMTLATTAFLVSPESTDARLIEGALGALYEDSLRIEFPNLTPRDEATARVSTRLHPVARSYFHPADNLGLMATVLESLTAVKELMLAFVALVYLAWQRWRNAIQREQQQQFSLQKEHLDSLLQQTLEIELALFQCDDATKLRQFLHEVTDVKVNALREFTDEELRGDNTFSIFQHQCDSLISRIQLRMLDAQTGEP